MFAVAHRRWCHIAELPSRVVALLRRNISSVHRLEVLLLLKRYPEREWRPREVGQELYTETISAGFELEALEKAGFAAQVGERIDIRYRYWPKTPELDDTVNELVGCYKEFRFRVIDAIFAEPRGYDDLKTFSDAFRFRREDTE